MDLTRVFRTHLDADRMDSQALRRLFRHPPGFATCLERSNQVLLGPRGSGKSMALRWLAYFDERPSERVPEFYGLRLPIGRFHFDHFRQTYLRTGDDRAFFAYFNWYLLAKALENFRRFPGTAKHIFRLPQSFAGVLSRHSGTPPRRALRSEEVDEILMAISELVKEFKKRVQIRDLDPGELAPTASLDDTIVLLESLYSLAELRGFSALGLLLDGFDHLGELADLLSPLFSKDEHHAERIVVKAACRALPRHFYATARLSRLEEGRDYSIVPIGLYDDVVTFREHLHTVMGNRFDALAGQGGSSHKIIDEVLPTGSDHLGRYTGFSRLADFAAGNILVFLETCALALQYEQERLGREQIEVLSPESQLQAIRKKSTLYLTSDLDDQAGEKAKDLKLFLDALGRHLKASGKQSLGLALNSDTFERIDNITLPFEEAIAIACEFRYLLTSRADLVPILRRMDGSTPERVMLSPTHAPAYDLSFEVAGAVPITEEDVKYQIDVKSRKKAAQIPLLPSSSYVFLSIAGDRGG